MNRKIESLRMIYFSPTQSTKKIINAIADDINCGFREEVDLTFAAFKGEQQKSIADAAIIGVPVYSGRIPEIVISRMNGIKGNGIPAIIIVLYGNREFEDALLELKDFVENMGFAVIAAASFIGEHSLSSKEQPIASGRPDALDIEKAFSLGRKINKKINEQNFDNNEIVVPGRYPYRERKPKSTITLVTNEKKCIACNKCIQVCPVSAIPSDNPLITDGEKCLRCSACVKSCPQSARLITDCVSKEIANRLFDKCKTRKEPEYFI